MTTVDPFDDWILPAANESDVIPKRPDEKFKGGRYEHQDRWYEPIDDPDDIDETVNWQMGKTWK